MPRLLASRPPPPLAARQRPAGSDSAVGDDRRRGSVCWRPLPTSCESASSTTASRLVTAVPAHQMTGAKQPRQGTGPDNTPPRPSSDRLVLASTHFVVDGYSNIYAPLLPLLIPQLNLSLAGRRRCRCASRWRTRSRSSGSDTSRTAGGRACCSSWVRSWRSRSCRSSGCRRRRRCWVLVLVVGGLGAAAFHPPAAALVHRLGGDRKGLAMSFHITGGSLRFCARPAGLCAVRRAIRAAVDAVFCCRRCSRWRSCCRGFPTRDASIEHLTPRGAGFQRAAAVRQAADAALSDRGRCARSRR